MVYYIDFSSEEAFYLQLRNQIILGIATASLHDGESLPSVRDMAETVGINMHTVNKAYTILRQEGYVRLDRRHGAVVCVNYDKQRKLDMLKSSLKVTLAEALCNGFTPQELHTVMDEVLEEMLSSL